MSAQTYLSKSEHFTGLPGISHEIQGQEAPLQKNENRKWNIIRKKDSYSPYSARLAALLVSSSVFSLWTLGFWTFSHAWSKIVTALLDSSAATKPPSSPSIIQPLSSGHFCFVLRTVLAGPCFYSRAWWVDLRIEVNHNMSTFPHLENRKTGLDNNSW